MTFLTTTFTNDSQLKIKGGSPEKYEWCECKISGERFPNGLRVAATAFKIHSVLLTYSPIDS